MVARTGAPNRTDNFKRKSFQVYSPEVNIGEVYFLKKIPSEMEVALLNKEHLGTSRNIWEHLGTSGNI